DRQNPRGLRHKAGRVRSAKLLGTGARGDYRHGAPKAARPEQRGKSRCGVQALGKAWSASAVVLPADLSPQLNLRYLVLDQLATARLGSITARSVASMTSRSSCAFSCSIPQN